MLTNGFVGRQVRSRIPVAFLRFAFFFALSPVFVIDAHSDDARLSDSLKFNKIVIDNHGPNSPWAKSVGDINNDGYLDIVVGGHAPRHLTFQEKLLRKLGISGFNPEQSSDKHKGELVWYESPDWRRHTISQSFSIRTDIEVEDINLDKLNDVVITSNEGVFWLEAPSWEPRLIDRQKMHDIEIADIDQNGLPDVITRNQSLFGYGNGNRVYINLQVSPGSWEQEVLEIPHGEGLKVYDMDADGFSDIVVNGEWLKNPANNAGSREWVKIDYASDQWTWQDVFIDVAMINDDERPDIVLAPAEEAKQRYQIAWFEAPKEVKGKWRKHIVDADVEAVHHFVAAADFNRDGLTDIATAEMNQSAGSDEVVVYGQESPDKWVKLMLDDKGSHSMRVADFDNDFDLDIFGAHWHIDRYSGNYPVSMWLNESSNKIPWRRHVIDQNRPGQATFVYAADLDGDRKKDIATGAYWYRQPETPDQVWQRQKIGKNANNVALIADFNGDRSLDILASGWYAGYRQPTFLERIGYSLGFRSKPVNLEVLVWGLNDGEGNFQIYDNIEQVSGDLLQGITSVQRNQETAVYLSWHRAEEGIQRIQVPRDPLNSTWKWSRISDYSQDEQLTAQDVDGDGEADLVLGSTWLRKLQDEEWKLETITNTKEKPDRHQVFDINGDGLNDIVIGYESVSKPGKLAWYENPGSTRAEWKERVIDSPVGPMSLGRGDLDNDGDIDLVVGEHNLKKPELSRLVWYENIDGVGGHWQGWLIHTGDEHHDGALTIDIDDDGDLDVVSIGWSHGMVLLYENLTIN